MSWSARAAPAAMSAAPAARVERTRTAAEQAREGRTSGEAAFEREAGRLVRAALFIPLRPFCPRVRSTVRAGKHRLGGPAESCLAARLPEFLLSRRRPA